MDFSSLGRILLVVGVIVVILGALLLFFGNSLNGFPGTIACAVALQVDRNSAGGIATTTPSPPNPSGLPRAKERGGWQRMRVVFAFAEPP